MDELLSRDPNVNAHDPRFGTALTTAARHGEVELMKTLVGMGADWTLGGLDIGLVVPLPLC